MIKFISILQTCFVLVGIFCFSTLTAASDTLTLKFKKTEWPVEHTNPGFITFLSKNPVSRSDSAILLSNGDITNKYTIRQFALQNLQDCNIFRSIKVLAGANSRNDLIVVVDKDGDSTFMNDEVYTIKLANKVIDRNQFYLSLPVIQLDSLLLTDCQGLKHFSNIRLKIAPAPTNTMKQFFSFQNEVAAAKGFLICFYEMDALVSHFEFNNEKYEIFITNNPLYFNNPELYAPDLKKELALRLIKQENGYFKNISFQLIYALEKDYLLKLSDSVSLRLLEFNNKDHVVKLEVVNGSAIDGVSKMAAGKVLQYKNYSFSNKRVTPLITDRREYTVVMFSGSWCVPCREILPDYKALYNELKGSVSFATITAETNKQAAQKYYDKSVVPWPFFYENLSESEDTMNLKDILNVRLYPTFILFDKTGTALLHESGMQGLEKIRHVIKTKLSDL